MKKLICLFLSCLPVLWAEAQTVPEKKLSSMKTTKLTKIIEQDGTFVRYDENDRALERHYYDKDGNLFLDYAYTYGQGGALDLSDFKYYTYENGRLASDSTSSRMNFYEYDLSGRLVQRTENSVSTGVLTVRYVYKYEYDAQGHLIKEGTYDKTGENISSGLEYTYDGNGLLTSVETKKNEYNYNVTPIAKEYRTIQREDYAYENGLLTEKETYTYTYGEDGVVMALSGKNEYTYDAQGRLASDAAYTVTGEVATPNGLTRYEYEGDTERIAKEELCNYDFDTEEFEIAQRQTYTYADYCADYVPVLAKIENGDEAAAVKLTVQQPAATGNFEGYKILANGNLIDGLFTGNELVVTGKQGLNTYRVFAVFDGIERGVSEEKTITLDFDLPRPSGMAVVSKEYSMATWTVAFIWKAPEEAPGMHLAGYRWTVTGSSGGSTSDPAVRKGTFKYYQKNTTTVSLYAVYEEGESEPVTMEVDLSDTSDIITAIWNNSRRETTDAAGNVLGSSHYYYQPSEISNSIYLCTVSVDFDGNGTPVARKTGVLRENSTTKYDYDTQEAWDAGTRSWKNDLRNDYTYNSYAVTSKTESKFDDATGEYVNVSRVDYSYDYATAGIHPVTTASYEYVDGDARLVSYAKHEYGTLDSSGGYLERTTTYYDSDAADAVITGKEELTCVSSNTPGVATAYAYVDGDYVPESRVTNTYSGENGLLENTRYETYQAGEWVVEKTDAYEGSKEYHWSHAVGLSYADGMLSWSAPVKVTNLTGYRIFLDNVLYEETTENSLSLDESTLSAGAHEFTALALFDGAEADISGVCRVEVLPAYDNLKALKEAELSETQLAVLEGEILLTGVLDKDTYAAEDATAGILISISDDAEVSTLAEGGKYTMLKGYVIGGNVKRLMITDASPVSMGNAVVPSDITIADVKKDAGRYEACYVKFSGVGFGDDSKTDINGKACYTDPATMSQEGGSMAVRFAEESVPFAASANVSGFVLRNDGGEYLYATAVEAIPETGISVVNDGAAFALTDGVLSVKDAVALEVYDIVGRKVAASATGEISLPQAGATTLLVKAVYGTRPAKVFKLNVR